MFYHLTHKLSLAIFELSIDFLLGDLREMKGEVYGPRPVLVASCGGQAEYSEMLKTPVFLLQAHHLNGCQSIRKIEKDSHC
jgi:hypothetical protein